MTKAYTATSRVVPPDRPIEDRARVLGPLANGGKLKILYALAGGERKVVEISEAVGERAPVITRHMAMLRVARLVQADRSGGAVRYQLTDSGLVALFMADGIRKCPRNELVSNVVDGVRFRRRPSPRSRRRT